MPTVRRLAPWALLCVLAGALLYAGWRTMERPEHAACSVCERPVHLASRVDGDAGGKSMTFCCAACALRAEGAGAASIRIIRVFDYETGEALDPAEATVVVGSEVNLCMRDHVLMDSHRDANELHYDRCSPSVLAFGSGAAAERFRIEHGGTVQPFASVEAMFQRPPQ